MLNTSESEKRALKLNILLILARILSHRGKVSYCEEKSEYLSAHAGLVP